MKKYLLYLLNILLIIALSISIFGFMLSYDWMIFTVLIIFIVLLAIQVNKGDQ